MTSTYDRIARFYDVDMAQNMRFDDVAFYAYHGTRQPGPVLELGCGNGRILLPLLARGLEVVGIDASGPMLAELTRKARARGLAPRTLRADVRRLPLRRAFSTVLAPYSLATYMATAADLDALLQAARDVLLPGGRFVIDAFVPRPVSPTAVFTEDYRRPFGAFTLVRSKRLTALDAHSNRIERRYELVAGNGRTVEAFEVAETIRPCSPDMLRDATRAAGFVAVTEAYDYGTRPDGDGAQFFTLVCKAQLTSRDPAPHHPVPRERPPQ